MNAAKSSGGKGPGKPRKPPLVPTTDRAHLKVSLRTHQRVMILAMVRGKGWTVDRLLEDLFDHAPEIGRVDQAIGPK